MPAGARRPRPSGEPEVLASRERPQRPRRSRRARLREARWVRPLVTGAVVLGVVAAGAQQVLGGERPPASPPPTPPPPAAAPVPDSPDAALAPRLPAGLVPEGATAYLSGAGGIFALALDEPAEAQGLRLPRGIEQAAPGGVVPLPAVTTVVTSPPGGEASGSVTSVFVLPPAAARLGSPGVQGALDAPLRVGAASTAFSGLDGRRVWLNGFVRGVGSAARPLDPGTGRSAGPAVPVPAPLEAVGEVTGGLVVASRFGQPGPVDVLRTADGRTERRLSTHAVVHDVAHGLVAFATCRSCPVRVADLRDPRGPTYRLELGPHRPVGQVRLAPDDRHVAAVVADVPSPVAGGAPLSYAVVLGHLPGTARAGRISVALRGLAPSVSGRPPTIAYTGSGWLVVSTGRTLYVVAPGPHSRYVVPVAVPEHREIAAR